MHLGSRRHGADNITSGERLNLVIWNHGLAWRESPGAAAHQRAYEQEGGPPDPRCVSYTHDRDYGTYKSYLRRADIPQTGRDAAAAVDTSRGAATAVTWTFDRDWRTAQVPRGSRKVPGPRLVPAARRGVRRVSGGCTAVTKGEALLRLGFRRLLGDTTSRLSRRAHDSRVGHG